MGVVQRNYLLISFDSLKTKVWRPLTARASRETHTVFDKSCLVLVPIYSVSFIHMDWGWGSTEYSDHFSIPVEIMLKFFTFQFFLKPFNLKNIFLRGEVTPQGLQFTNSHSGLALNLFFGLPLMALPS